MLEGTASLDVEDKQTGKLDSSVLLRLWDGTRRTVEAFDKSIADIRRIYLALIAAISAVGASLSGTSAAAITLAFSVLIVAFTLIFWGLDTHYHAYLKVAAQTASRLEARLELVDKHLGVTTELGAYRFRSAVTPRIFHLIYLLPGLGAALAFGWTSGDLAAGWPPTDWRYRIVSIILIGAVFAGILLYVIIADEKFWQFTKRHSHPDL